MSAAPLVLFALDELSIALELGAVEKVVRAVEITPLPGSPAGMLGIVSVAGRIVPVFDLRARFGLAPRTVRSTDHLAIVRTAARTLALLVDSPMDVTEKTTTQITPADAGLSRLPSLRGVAQLASGIVQVHDLERFLSVDDESALENALLGAAAKPVPHVALAPAPAQ